MARFGVPTPARASMQIPCPVTGKPLIPDASMLMMRAATPIICPACAGRHWWDPKRRIFIAEAPDFSRTA